MVKLLGGFISSMEALVETLSVLDLDVSVCSKLLRISHTCLYINLNKNEYM